MTTTLAAVLWDMDGTLVDSEPVWIAQQLAVAEQRGGTWSTEQGLALVGADMHDTALAMQAAGVDLEAAELLGVRIEQCVAVKDSSNGLASAMASGAAALAVPNDAVLPDAGDLTTWPTLAGRTVAALAALLG